MHTNWKYLRHAVPNFIPGEYVTKLPKIVLEYGPLVTAYSFLCGVITHALDLFRGEKE